MSYNFDFVNNKKYGADDINAIRSLIMSAGVIKAGDNDCMVSVADGNIEISPGQAIFSDGCRIEVDEKEVIPYESDISCVYFDRNYAGEPCPGTGASFPDGCIPLAELNGTEVSDARSFSSLRVPSMQKNRYTTKEINLNFTYPNPMRITTTLDFADRSEINYILIENQYTRITTKLFYNFDENYVFGISYDYDIYTNADKTIHLYALSSELTVSRQGSTVNLDIYCPGRLNLGTLKVTVL